MSGDYRKYAVEMALTGSEYRLWKKGADNCVCVVESYKSKRSIYFAVSNLLSSSSLQTNGGREYHLVLIGAEDGQLIHRDFGAFFINQKGEGSFFKKFEGAPLECYTHCLFLGVEIETGKTETIMSGKMPFFNETEESREEIGEFDLKWRTSLDLCTESHEIQAFSKDRDETAAKWYRISREEGTEAVPEPLADCGALIEKYKHFILGEKDGRYFAGVPGRFLKAEQPCREEGRYTLWQPIRGGEEFMGDFSDLSETLLEEIFGYWIGAIDGTTGEITAL